jgi:CelD/BcsL family acetyltransferase involved in cellulose biosynthesis
MAHDPSVRMSSSQAIFSPELRVTEIDPWKDPRWAAYVLRHPEATVYHHPAWLAALRREYQQTGLFLACEDGDGALQGIFPLLYTRGIPLSGGPLTGRRLCSLPRTPLAGPLATDPPAREALLCEAVRRASASRSVRLQIKTQAEGFAAGVDGIVRKDWRLSYIVPLAGQPGQPYHIPGSQNRSSIKRAINKAIAGGVRVRPAETEDELRTWYRMYLETMRRNFVPARPYRFFLALWDLMRENGMMRLLIAEHQDTSGTRMIGGHLFLIFGNTVTYAFGASRTADFALRPNDIIMGRAINDASEEGFRFVDLGEVPEGDENLARFKSKWGAEPVRLYRYYSPDFPDGDHVSDETGLSAAALVGKIWIHLPLTMTSWLGDRIYAYL